LNGRDRLERNNQMMALTMQALRLRRCPPGVVNHCPRLPHRRRVELSTASRDASLSQSLSLRARADSPSKSLTRVSTKVGASPTGSVRDSSGPTGCFAFVNASHGVATRGGSPKCSHPSVSAPFVQSVSSRCCQQYRVPSSDRGRPSSDNEWVKRIEQSERSGTE